MHTHLDHVGGESVGAADEPEHRGLVSDLVPELLESLAHEWARLFRVDGVHLLHLWACTSVGHTKLGRLTSRDV